MSNVQGQICPIISLLPADFDQLFLCWPTLAALGSVHSFISAPPPTEWGHHQAVKIDSHWQVLSHNKFAPWCVFSRPVWAQSECLFYRLVLSSICTLQLQMMLCSSLSVTSYTRIHSSPEQRSVNVSPRPKLPSLSGSRSSRPRSWSSSPLSRAQAGPGCCDKSRSRPGSERSGRPEGCTTCTRTADAVWAWEQSGGKQTGGD